MAARELAVEGVALLGDDFEEVPARIVVEGGTVRRIEEIGERRGDLPWILPAFFNAHTHLGDSIAMDIPLEGDLDAIVRPPDGLKHRILRATPRGDLVRAMRLSIRAMARGGTAGFADFREGGREGVGALREAARGIPCRPVILGREGGEEIADGIGISSARDVVGHDLDGMVSRAREAGKIVAFHAGERDPGDIDAALSYDPDLLVHCTHATREQLRRIADLGVPVAVCPRANWRFAVTSSPEKPPVRELLSLGCTLLLGTDNAMCVQPDMWGEMAFLCTVYRVAPRDALRAATAGASVLGRAPSLLAEGNPARFLVVDPRGSNLALSRDIAATLVHRAGPANIVRKVIKL
ncbi:MAG: amidohydrolase family protein [Methanolinea sp.]|nr:amidohydrolase family protein [Methanolinea sp.]